METLRLGDKKNLTSLFILVAFAMLGASCDSPIVAETTNSISVESASDKENLDEVDSESNTTTSITVGLTVVPSTTDAVTTASSTVNTVIDSTSSTTTIATTTTTLSRKPSPAWVESQALDPKSSGMGDGNLDDLRSVISYYSNNPNDILTPMGALCWAYHEISRAFAMGDSRYMLDQFAIPFFMEHYGVTNEQVGPPGVEATGAFLDLVSSSSGPVGSTSDGSGGQKSTPGGDGDGDEGPVGSTGEDTTDDTIEFLGIHHEFAGDGTAWLTAVRAVASPEMVAAFKMGEGLPVDVQVYADALVAFARERVGKDIDLSAESDDLSFGSPEFPGIESFIETAKYHQDCERARIEDL